MKSALQAQLISSLDDLGNQLNGFVKQKSKKYFIDLSYFAFVHREWDSCELFSRYLVGEELRETAPVGYEWMVDYFKPFFDPKLSAYIARDQILRFFDVREARLRIATDHEDLRKTFYLDDWVYSWEDCRSIFELK